MLPTLFLLVSVVFTLFRTAAVAALIPRHNGNRAGNDGGAFDDHGQDNNDQGYIFTSSPPSTPSLRLYLHNMP